ncbi:MAG: hypothetical protein ACI4PS_04650 [Rhodocyclaceae bacterium]
MKIASSNIALQSDHSKKEQHYVAETLRVRNGDNISVETQRTYLGQSENSSQTKVSLSEKALQLLQNEQENANKNANENANANLLRRSVQNNNAVQNNEIDAPEDPKLLLIRAIIEAITGKSIKFVSESAANQSDKANSTTPTMANLANANGGEVIAVSSGNTAFGLRYNSNEVIKENETTNFSASGIIKTADGKEIQFQCDLSMQRSFYMDNSTEIFMGASTDRKSLCDPLIINFAGTAAELKNTTFAFDLNADGSAENIQELAAGSAFLVLDKNKDGKINNGNEMFGTQSGDGFADLSVYDEDGNGWIDENDSVYNSLGVWNNSAYGGKIRSLKEAGIGAIYLQNANTEFSIKDKTTNELQGQIRKTGIFLNEKNGNIGTIQHVDLAI